MIHEIAQFITDQIFDMGYLGIFLLMLIESSFIPFPSEIVLIPAGYLASKGDMDISLILLAPRFYSKPMRIEIRSLN